jgi:hypothetical protein
MNPLRLSLTVALMLAAGPLAAQEARLTGTVSDPSGAVLVGVEIAATQTERGVVAKTASDHTGRYVFPRLAIGPYQIKADAKGFRTFVQSSLHLTTAADALLNITMQLGNVSDQITVSADASRVATETATMQQLVDSSRIVELPLNGRNVYSLATLVPGTGTSGVNIGGGRSGSQNSGMLNVRVDGALNIDNVFQQTLPLPSPDAVQEFTIQTSVPPAKYGYAAGVIETATKSGTNALHGSFYEFFRNDKLDARSFFLAQKTKRKRNQYGFAGGGPVYLPKIYNGRNRTFWFLNLEQQKEPLSSSVTIYTPNARQMTGDFSQAGRAIRDPLNNQVFPNAQIPQSRLDPLALNFIREYVPVSQDALGLVRYTKPNSNNPSQALIKGDQVLGGGKHQLSGKVFVTRLTAPAAAGNLPAFQIGDGHTDTDLFAGSYTANVSSNKINTARFSLNGWYQNNIYVPTIELDALRKLGWSKNFYTYTPNFPVLSVSGAFTASIEQIRIARDYNTFAFNDDFSWIRGRHSIQLGIDGIRTIQHDDNMSRTNGVFTYSGSLSGLGLTDFMLGRPATFRQGSPAPDDTRGLNLAWYVQDDVKVSRRLTLNLGLRHELAFPPVAVNDAMIQYRPGAKSTVYVNAHPGMLFYGDPGVLRAGRAMNKKLFAPRVGLAYTLTSDQKTVLRAGYGIYYNPTWSNVEGQFAIYQPFTRIIDLVTPPSTGDPWGSFPGGNPHPYKPSRESPFDMGIVGLTYGANFTEPVQQQWNLNIQRELWRHWLVTVGYAGSRGTHSPYMRDFNAPVYIPGRSTVANANDRRPLAPYFARFSSMESVSNSSYNSLQAALDKRLARGLTVIMAYTFSKALNDFNSVLYNSGAGQDPNNRAAEWAPASYDNTHVFKTSWLWRIPSGRLSRGWKGFFFGRWELNGILTMYTGDALAFSLSQDRALRSHSNRPDRIKDPRLPSDRTRAERINEWFDRTAFVPNQTGQFGNAPRAESQLRGPGNESLTLGMHKKFRGVFESHALQFRAEFFNALNRPNFGNPGTNPDSPGSYGRITGAGDGRIIQFALKYIF